MKVEIRCGYSWKADLDPEDFRGFSRDEIVDELRAMCEADGHGSPNEGDLKWTAEDIESELEPKQEDE